MKLLNFVTRAYGKMMVVFNDPEKYDESGVSKNPMKWLRSHWRELHAIGTSVVDIFGMYSSYRA